MGGQACVFYGAAEFSRDCDIVIVADEGVLSASVREDFSGGGYCWLS
jgi:hypothetical protein